MTLGQAIDLLRNEATVHGCRLVSWRMRNDGTNVFTFERDGDRFCLRLPPRALNPADMLGHMLKMATARR